MCMNTELFHLELTDPIKTCLGREGLIFGTVYYAKEMAIQNSE